MKLVHSLVEEASHKLSSIADNPLREARLLMAHILQVSYEEIYFNSERFLSESEEFFFQAALTRRLAYEPLSKILGYREFWSLPFRTTEDTLDPRPDSETLIEAVLTYFPDKQHPWRILDLGTGTGCLLLSLIHEYPNAKGVGVDISQKAIKIAQDNAHHLNLTNRTSFVVCDWTKALGDHFDILISNPPYIGYDEPLSTTVVQYDPHLALFGGQDGFKAYEELSLQITSLMRPESRLFLEIGLNQEKAVQEIFSHLCFLETIKDLSGIERCCVFGV